jgi:nitric oxide reductase NorQ protein
MSTIYYKPFQTETGRYMLEATSGETYKRTATDQPSPSPITLQKAVSEGQALEFDSSRETNGWRRVDMEMFFNHANSNPVNELQKPLEVSEETEEIKQFIHSESYSLKPNNLVLDELRWKYAVRSVIRSQNVLVCGPTGSGKTMMVKWLAESLSRPLHIFNLGSTQDPRATLIGNTHFDQSRGTFFSQSPFIEAIQQPNSIILLDELSRANPEAFNILMSVLDPNQRYLRIDESVNSPIINVHPTVTFIGTANVGMEYTSTRVIDRALQDRFVTIQMDYLDEEGERELLSNIFSEVEDTKIKTVAKLVTLVREDVKSEDGQLERNLSTRHSIEMVSLINDGFTLEETLQIVVFPNYSSEGGLESELTYVKQLLQSVMDDSEGDPQPQVVEEDEIPMF